ncbi:unnamed protein product [Trichogramma brassicae]|uniref:Reverse transcriptase domain-containing protein n=1 Tax=Trichogramma brassicae TaxID=86971 RepID=A0A6H5IR92_9HYME|nr:unnamed protein product [Trichogramma brassicae]
MLRMLRSRRTISRLDVLNYFASATIEHPHLVRQGVPKIGGVNKKGTLQAAESRKRDGQVEIQSSAASIAAARLEVSGSGPAGCGTQTATKAPGRKQVLSSTEAPVPPPRLISSRHESPQLFGKPRLPVFLRSDFGACLSNNSTIDYVNASTLESTLSRLITWTKLIAARSAPNRTRSNLWKSRQLNVVSAWTGTSIGKSYQLEHLLSPRVKSYSKIPQLPGEHRRRVHMSTFCIEWLNQGDTLEKIPRLPGENRHGVHMSTFCIETEQNANLPIVTLLKSKKFKTLITVKICSTPSSPSDTRPISLLAELSKIVERLAHAHLSRHSLLDPQQHGFRPGHSTQTALLDLTESVRMAVEKRKITALVSFDFSKAFDTIDHGLLISKLRRLGCDALAVEWFSSYLSSRSLSVKSEDGALSEQLFTTSGIPQGSSLGPLLFAIFINDLHIALRHSKHIIYADDTAIF